MNMSRIGYFTIGPDGEPTHTYLAWNPFGLGCSGCSLKNNGCWSQKGAKRLAGQIEKCGTGDAVFGHTGNLVYHICKSGGRKWRVCKKCARFEVHMHPERLDQPARRKKPSLILCNFTNDWMDEARPFEDLATVFWAMADAPQHTYVTLTKNAGRMGRRHSKSTKLLERLVLSNLDADSPNWYTGLTIRNQSDMDRMGGDFFGIPGKLWISNEPVQGEVDWGLVKLWELACKQGREFVPPIQGIIVGHNKRRGAPGTETTDHIRSTVKQCDAAGVPRLVKQIWAFICPAHGTDAPRIDRHSQQTCNACGAVFRWKLLRASHKDEYALYPDWARGGQLPWPAQAERTPT